MIINFDELTPGQRYFHTIQTLIPRPIAWILSEHSNGSFNIAPFSYFSAVCSDPALIMISVGRKSEHEEKDTCRNIEARNNFVVHIPDMSLIDAMNASAETLPADVSEVDRLGLETVPFDGFPLPRLKAAKVAYGCELFEIRKIGHGSQSLIFGEIKSIHLDESVIDRTIEGRIKVDAEKLNPVARLGADEYASLSEVIRMKRPA
ncbi:NADH-FMN oxidoreductase RutF, flavin reductase (DIM6/NTAB) family [Mariprofundus ferrinatatus]|uniref:NADH-FMN oxidoreductase RutF, flavin reductase (DIM6/NTAB) family n=1 Tax=Mariprofundus ferrinatatus TaxID=1921087 RepID=A0A2K8LDX0_9PROT|nr:flavin reductase family protein [Mariprofundus ferrinatatus]ATX82476.1 NADH-FMN oxidoreductase RutF, flavin reductase (DIM6/NTAB) family [Mariprofundus ferrinatatus]